MSEPRLLAAATIGIRLVDVRGTVEKFSEDFQVRLAALITVLLLFALVPVFIFGDTIDDQFGGDKGVELLSQYGHWAWIFAIGLIISDLFLPVPAPAVMATLGLLYGPILGGIIGGVGSTLAGLVAYGGCRLLGPRVARVLAGDDNLPKLSQFFRRSGAAAIAFSRWLPILPEGLACLAGLARMPFVRFLSALGVGSFAMGFAFSSLGSAYNEQPTVGILISAIVPLALWPIVHRWLQSPSEDPTALSSDRSSRQPRSQEIASVLSQTPAQP